MKLKILRKTKLNVAVLVLNPNEHMPLLRADACELLNKGLLQKLADVPFGYCAPRSWRQMARKEWPQPHPDVLALVAKAVNRGAKL